MEQSDVLAGIMADLADLDQLEEEVSNKEAESEKSENKGKRKERNGYWTSTSSEHGHTLQSSTSENPSTTYLDEKDKRTRTEKSRDKENENNLEKEIGETSSKRKTVKSTTNSLKPKNSTKRNVRYFIIKSFTHKHLEISIQKAIWSTQAHNEQKLNEAYENSDVILIFSVNNSRHFQGYAKMISKIGKEYTNVWAFDGSSPWGGVFKVEWLTLFNLPFGDTLHIRNPLNNHKPVKISRDGQELPVEVGQQLCDLLDEGFNTTERNKRKNNDGEDEHVQKKIKTSELTQTIEVKEIQEEEMQEEKQL